MCIALKPDIDVHVENFRLYLGGNPLMGKKQITLALALSVFMKLNRVTNFYGKVITKCLICTCFQPDSVKLNAIIEKTALFISQQGAQMEILLKMKQANNPQFQFLSFDSQLHPYYRHLLMAIKTGRYRPKTQEQEKEGLYMFCVL